MFSHALRRSLRVLLVGAALCLAVSPAAAQTPSPPPSPGPTAMDAQEQVVLSGSVLVPRGQTSGEIVVFHGRATVLGVALGDVVVLDGPITVAGQVSGSVIALNGPIRLTSSASVRGDVRGARTVRVDQGATVAGDIQHNVAFTPRGSLTALGALLGGVAIAFSVLVLGLLMLLAGPRGADRIASAARSAPFASAGWGLALAIGLPLVGVMASVTILGLPLGLALLLALAFVFLVSATWTVWAVGRALVREPRSRWLAFLAGWAIALAVSLVPYLSAAGWTSASVFGLGLMAVAVWRARGKAGRHRAGYAEASEPEVDASEASGPEMEAADAASQAPVTSDAAWSSSE